MLYICTVPNSWAATTKVLIYLVQLGYILDVKRDKEVGGSNIWLILTIPLRLHQSKKQSY